MKFFPPEDEIRAQLRELTSQTRQLRKDLQGMIKRRSTSGAAFSHDQRYRLRPERPASSSERPEPKSDRDSTDPQSTGRSKKKP
jgi:hypothetical protein